MPPRKTAGVIPPLLVFFTNSILLVGEEHQPRLKHTYMVFACVGVLHQQILQSAAMLQLLVKRHNNGYAAKPVEANTISTRVQVLFHNDVKSRN